MIINLRPSRRLAVVLSLAHVAAAGACLLPALPMLVCGALVTAVAASCLHAVRGRALLRAADSIIALQVEEGGRLWVQTAGEGWCAATLHDSTFVYPWLTVFGAQMDRHYFPRHAVILADSVDAEDFRKLRVWLRWRSGAVESARVNQ